MSRDLRSPSVVERARRSMRDYFKPRRIGVLIGATLLAMILGSALYPRFPSEVRTLEKLAHAEAPRETTPVPPESDPLFAQVLAAHGGLAAFRAAAQIEARFSDEWTRWFENFSVWPGHSTSGDLSLAPVGHRYEVRFALQRGVIWGFDLERPWVVDRKQVGFESLANTRIRHASIAFPRLYLLPFSVVHEGAELLPPPAGLSDVIAVRFRHPRYPKIPELWVLYLDKNTHLINRAVFEARPADPGFIESCLFESRTEVGGMRLATRIRCELSNAVAADLHTLEFTQTRILNEVRQANFRPPIHMIATSSAARSQRSR